jgi:hypothetical protein
MTTIETVTEAPVAITRRAAVGRRTAMMALVVGAVLNQAASTLAMMFNGGDTSVGGYAAAITERGPLGVLSAMANVVGIPLMLLGVIGLLQYSGRRAPVAARIGLVATAIGFVGFLSMSASLAALYDLARPLDPAQQAPLLSALAGETAGPVFAMFLLSFLLGSVTGMVATAVALWRSRAVPRWLPITLLIFVVADFLAPDLGWFDAHVVFVIFAVGSAVAIARKSDHDWYGA